LKISQEFNRISGGIPTLLGIPRSVNKLRDKAKSGGRNYSLKESESPTMVEGEYTYRFSISDGSIWIDLTVSFVSTLFNSSTSEKSRDIIYIIFLNYIFF